MVGNLPLMRQMNTIAQEEKNKNVPILDAGIQFWTAVADLLENNHQALGAAANRVAERWRDTTHPIAFQEPVDAGLDSIKKSVQTIVKAKPQEAARTAIGHIETIAGKIASLLEQYIVVHNLAETYETLAEADPMGFEAQMLAQLEAKMKMLEQQAAEQLRRMGTQGYAPAKPSVKAAGDNHVWNGSQSASAASAASKGGSDVVASTASASADGTAETGQPSTAHAPDMGQYGSDAIAGGAGQTEDAGETELAGGATTAPAPPMTNVPPAGGSAGAPTPGVGAPAGAPLGGAGILGRAGGGRMPGAPTPAGLGAKGASSGQIPQAAKVPGGIVSATSGTSPSLPAESTGAAGGSGARKSGMVRPMGMGAGVPAMLAPMGMGSVQGLINRLKPIVTRPGVRRVEEREPAPGVPTGLRGRTARTDDDDAFLRTPRPINRNGRSTSSDGPPETVQLLDEEIWQTEQSSVSEKGSIHR